MRNAQCKICIKKQVCGDADLYFHQLVYIIESWVFDSKTVNFPLSTVNWKMGGYMERILIIGCSGSGKSTLARALGKKLGLPVVHLDQLWWREDWENVTKEEFDEALERELEKSQWIMDGNYSRTMERRLQKCDTIFYLDFSRWECLLGMCQRVLGSNGHIRPDMSDGCPERFDPEFVKWIWNFNKNNRVQNYTWIAKTRHAQSIVLKNRREVRQFLESIPARKA